MKEQIDKDFMFKDTVPDIFWSDVPIDRTNTIRVVILDFTKLKESKFDRSNYWMFKVIPVETCRDPYMQMDKLYHLHLPKRAFIRAYNRARKRQVLEKTKVYDVRVDMKRINKGSIQIMWMEYEQVN